MGPDVGDFLRQIPPFPIILLCGSAILLMVSIFFIVRARIIKAQERAILPSTEPASYPTFSPAAQASMGDLPDLDLLVGSSPPPPASPAAPRQPRKGLHAVSLSDGGSVEAVEVMAIMRDVVNGGLIIQMGDKTYRNLTSDENFKTDFLKVMRELSPLVKGAPATASSTTTEETDTPAQEETPASLYDVADTPAPAQPPKPYIPPPPAPDGSIPGALPRYDVDHRPAVPAKRGLLGRGKLDLPPVPEINVAGSIETYLQHKLRYTPEYSGRSIHVHPAPDGGVAIEVDGQFFETVGDVTDSEVRDFLSATIQEWQTQR